MDVSIYLLLSSLWFVTVWSIKTLHDVTSTKTLIYVLTCVTKYCRWWPLLSNVNILVHNIRERIGIYRNYQFDYILYDVIWFSDHCYPFRSPGRQVGLGFELGSDGLNWSLWWTGWEGGRYISSVSRSSSVIFDTLTAFSQSWPVRMRYFPASP